MGLPLRLFFLLQLLRVMTTVSSSSSSPASPVECGKVKIPYPFGVRNGTPTAGWKDFDVECHRSSPFVQYPRLLVGGKGDLLQILEISPELGYVRVAAGPIAEHCGGIPTPNTMFESSSWIDLEGTPFTFSQARNNFTVVGCDTLSMMRPSGSPRYTTGCAAFCDSEQGALDQSCSGIGCCQVAIPRGLQRFALKFRSVGTASDGACSKAYLVNHYEGLDPSARTGLKLPLALEWVIGYETCAKALRSASYACKDNTECLDSLGIGYSCACKPGYTGNPYDPQGCRDINECMDRTMNDCVWDCVNDPGGFHCKCPKGMIGDGRVGGSRCTSKEAQWKLKFYIGGAGVGIFCLLLLVGSFWSYCLLQRRRLANVKEKCFRHNGGLLLQKHIASQKGNNGGAKIFTAEEIEKATNNFSERRILGRGGQGTVYKGILPDKRIVAIKKSRISDETQIEQFINEVVILSQINHKNVVKLLGCCLETQVPLLVSEYVSNGTLSDLIHGKKHSVLLPLSWDERLRIAAETAGALAYLHSAAYSPVIHRDVKSTNILLDRNFTAKVSDFGASKFVPLDRTHITTLVQGTLGYLDPEYFTTSQLTEKSDVYSFGVVLVELLTGDKPISSVRPEVERNLALHFITSLENKRLRQVLEAEIVCEAGIEHLGVVARLAQRCLSLKGEDRPSMKEVAMELHWARQFLTELANMEGSHGETDQSISVANSSPDLHGTV